MDPIVTIPKAPEDSLSFSLSVDKGQKRLLRNIGRYRALYLEGSITSSTLSLKTGETYTVGKVKALVIQTPNNLNVELFVGSSAMTVTVKQLLMLDCSLEQAVITALSDTRVNVAFISE